MKKKSFLFFILYILLFNFSTAFGQSVENNKDIPLSSSSTTEEYIENDTALELEADSAILIDAKTGEVLYKKNIEKKQYPASITKLMTVLLAMEYGKFDEKLTFSKEAVFGIERNSSHIAIDVGEQITLEQSLYAIMLASANEVASGVAEHIGGSIDNFAKLMNEKAKELGAKNTHFVNANGLHNDNHYTTAYDMALITKELLKYDKFREVAKTTYYEIGPTNKQPETRYLYAQHKMIKKNSKYYYPDCEGGKTGFTDKALNTLVSFAKKGDTELISVVLYDKGESTYTDTTKLFDYGFSNYETVKLLAASGFSADVPVVESYKDKEFDAGTAKIATEDDIYVTLPKNASKSLISQKPIYDESFKTPVNEGDIKGSLEFIMNNKIIASTNLIAQNDVSQISKETLQKETKKPINDILLFSAATMLIIIFLFIIFRVILYKRRKSKLRKSRRFKCSSSKRRKIKKGW